MYFKKYALNKLKEQNYRITKARHLTLDILEKSHKPQNAYEITQKILALGNNIDVTTVYRVLEVLRGNNLVHFVKDLQGYIKCEYVDCTNTDHCHHQFVCNKCHEVSEVHLDNSVLMEQIKSKYPKLNINSHYLELSGTCKKCN